jgi:F-type H+-transporting ATPase subunit gamma
MANLKEIRSRITSVSSTQQITKAMKMVSAAKLRKAQDAIVQLRPYANKLQDLLANVSATLENNEGIYSTNRELKNVLIIPITSNRGLCGAFNNNVIKRANYMATVTYAKQKVSVLCIGKKADEFFKKTEYHIIGQDLPRHLNEIFDKLTFDNVAPIAQHIMNAFADKQFDKVVLVYNQFKNAAVQVLSEEQFLPLQQSQESSNNKNISATEYIFEPSKEFIVTELIPKSLKLQLYKALLDSNASEHGARMTAMHKATDNAGSMIKELKLTYNKARQASITNEILEIVGGAEALKS